MGDAVNLSRFALGKTLFEVLPNFLRCVEIDDTIGEIFADAIPQPGQNHGVAMFLGDVFGIFFSRFGNGPINEPKFILCIEGCAHRSLP